MLPLVAALALAAPPAEVPELARGRAMIEAYFRHQAKLMDAAALAGVTSRAEWERRRPEYRRQILDMLGLWPLPERTDLHATVTGTLERDGVVIEKLHFQSRPGLYVTANLYRPAAPPAGRLPAVIYVCGHGNVVEGGVSFGSKVRYQHHPDGLARHGFVAIVLDTLELGESNGNHHGTHNKGWWDWHTRGYTPAGVECWNAMRAIDYLETRPEVDAKRIGVTGRSGGSATSWWLMAADDRPACAVPVAGIADMRGHLWDGVSPRFPRGLIDGHCDCMYMTNTYRWDFARVAAMAAPRPLLLANSDADPIFPVPAYRRVAEKVRTVYDLYNAGDHFAVLETSGPHLDTPELRLGAFRWLKRWLQSDTAPVSESTFTPLKPQQLKVFASLPSDSRNPTIHESFVRPARVVTPESPEVVKGWWPGQAEKWRSALREQVFAGWPTSPPDLNVRPAADITHDGVRLRAWDFTSEEAIDLRLWLVTAPAAAKTTLAVLDVLDEPAWREWLAQLGPAFAGAVPGPVPTTFNATAFAQNRRVMERFGWAFAAVAPRGVGPTRWAEPGSKEDIHTRRRFVLAGQTLDGQRVWDVRRALAALRSVPDLNGVPRWLQGHREAAGLALYAGLFEPEVARFDLWHPPASHDAGPTLLNVRKVFDTPQAIALAAPRPVRLYVADDAEAKAWAWPLDLQRKLGTPTLQLRAVGR
jgi:dienelactone hydrolase